ncbi:hypothetical protein OG318_01985 [Streptomyces sp. NBC_01483]|nr:hypothetical protein [Streptomyces sp. NBC_01483]
MKDETLAAKTARLGCATLVDAIGRVHSHRVHIPSMASPDPSRTLFGRAATISFMPYREDLVEPGRDFAYLFYGALGGRAPTPGQVLVLSSGGYPDVSHGGGTKLSRGDGHGLADVLADGRLRDFDQLRGYSFATWCRGEAGCNDWRAVARAGEGDISPDRIVDKVQARAAQALLVVWRAGREVDGEVVEPGQQLLGWRLQSS